MMMTFECWLASRASNLIIDLNSTILVFVVLFLCDFPAGRACISVVVMMMLGECWLASRASNLITVITGGIQLALTGLSDPHHSYTRTITLVNIFVFLYFCICVFV